MTNPTQKPIETKNDTQTLSRCIFCKSDTRINTSKFRIKKTSEIIEASQIKCKRMSCGMSGPLFKGEASRVAAKAHWNAWNTRTAPKVNQLVWEQSFAKWKQKAPAFGKKTAYEVGHRRGKQAYLRHNLDSEISKEEFDHIELAKAAAQSHYEQTILSALET